MREELEFNRKYQGDYCGIYGNIAIFLLLIGASLREVPSTAIASLNVNYLKYQLNLLYISLSVLVCCVK